MTKSTNKQIIEGYFKATNKIIKDIDKREIDRAIKLLFDTWKSGGRVFTMGNGGSASTASHFTADLCKTVAYSSSDKEIVDGRRGIISFCLNENPALTTAWTNDSGWESVYEGQLNNFLEEGDVLLLISVHGGSGWSANLPKAMEVAKKRGAKVLGFSGFDGGLMKKEGDVCIVVPKNSTPHVEGFHGVLQHLIVARLQELILNEIKKQNNSKEFEDGNY